MKKLYKILFMAFIFNSLIYSQWEDQTINFPRGNYMSVYMQDSLVGWIAGDILLKTTDGGSTWVPQKFGDNQEQIYDIKFLDDSIGFARGSTSNKLVFYKTSDGGKGWAIDSVLDSISISTGITFSDISFTTLEDSTIVWCIGYSPNPSPATGFIYYSIDKGNTWNQFDKVPAFNTLHAKITFVDSSKGFFSTGEKLFRTLNGGENWQQYQFDILGINYIEYFQFFNPDTGYFIAQRQSDLFSPLFIGKTFNGGESWTIDSTTQGFFPYPMLIVIYFVNPNLGFAVDWSKNFVLRTTDGGSNWTKYISQNPAPLYSIHSSDGKTVIAAGPNSHILVSKDSGSTWNDLTPPAEINFEYIKYFSNSFIIAFDCCNVYHSFDSCNTWTKYTLPTGLDICITLLDSLKGWIADDSSRIYNTTNSGRTWSLQREYNYLDPNSSLDPLKGIHFFNDNIGCSVGGNGYITATVNGGESWESKISPTSNTLYGVFVASVNKAWAVGEEGTIITTSDSCNSWSFQESPIDAALRSVTFLDTLQGYILGDNGTILKTTNGGQLWELVTSPYSSLNAMKFVSTNVGWIVANNGKILSTLNGGEQWDAQESSVQSNLTYVDFIDSYLGIIVGENGVILTTKNGGGITSVKNDPENILPKTFELKQNFPNPFNPITNIRFRIANFGFVTLKVYDVLGREVATLVNEEKPAGEYEVNFEASHLSSGICFYKLQAGNYSSTKKMIYLK